MSHIICDLDGVLWRGATAIPGARESLIKAMEYGFDLTFATNNSTKTPGEVVDKIRRVLDFDATPDAVVTSSLAAASMLEADEGPVFVVGEGGIIEALADVGHSTTVDPAEANAVIVGLDRDFAYHKLSLASEAIRAGARFIATNTDPTFPTETGLEPGSGSIVDSVQTASGQKPEVAGKPNRPMAELVRSRRSGPAWVIGDRLDTDIELASNDDEWRSILVLTGVTGEGDRGVEAADLIATDISSAIDLVLADAGRS